MLFMVIETFRDPSGAAVGERFRKQGRMLPEQVVYRDSWLDPIQGRCFQLMEAPGRDDFEPWLRAWQDLVDFEVVPVVTSAEFWAGQSGQARAGA